MSTIIEFFTTLFTNFQEWLELIWRIFNPQDVIDPMPFHKPVIYLYPEKETEVDVKLKLDGKLTVTYPDYAEGWSVRACPDGTLVNNADGKEYSYLFWEGIPNKPDWDFSEGYCVAGKDSAVFLQEKLAGLGLTPREYNEFIVFWLPKMQENLYNLVTFQWENYENFAPLEISPVPDSVLRVFMVYKPLKKPVEIAPPAPCPAFERKGFTVVEWGGSEA
ncbi:MAG: hypothetical protein FWG82_02840 [Oscillospiraceae bacterium]|nr:hypothetical protein [Oscillospiraceae bacterium]